jgi:uncharacterized membrane protein
MSDLLVILFDDVLKAAEVRRDLLEKQGEHSIDLEDAVVLVMNRKGKVKLHHVTHLTPGGALTEGSLGGLLDAIILAPILAMVGLPTDGTRAEGSGSPTHLGIDEEFMKELAGHLKPGTSALCILVKGALEKVFEELKRFDGKIFRTSLSHEDESRLMAAFDDAKNDLKLQIAKRAYELYEQRGRQNGQALQDWFQAEREIREETHK